MDAVVAQNIKEMLDRGEVDRAEALSTDALKQAARNHGDDSAEYGEALIAHAEVQSSRGDFRDAETAFRQAYDLCTRHLGSEHADTIAAANALAAHLLLIDEREEAEPIILQTWHKAQGVLHEGQPEFAAASIMMGRLLAEKGDFENAEPLLRTGADLSERYHGRNSLEAADAALSLGVFLQKAGQISEVERWLHRALTIYERLLGERSQSYALALVAMGNFLEVSHVYGRAWEIYFKAYTIDREIMGSDHPACVNHLLRIARMCQAAGSKKDALWAYNEAIQIAGKVHGPNHPTFAACMEHFSSMLVESGNTAQALELLERATRIRKVIHGEQHPDYLACLLRTAQVYMATGDLHLAKELLTRTSETYIELNATSDPQYASILLTLAAISVQEHRPERALTLVREAMEVETRIAHHVFSVTSEATREGMVAHLSIFPALALSLTAQFLRDDPVAVKSAFDSVVRQKGIDGEIHLSQRVWSAGTGDAKLNDRLKRLQAMRKLLAAEILGTRSGATRHSMGTISELHEKIDTMEADLARSMPLAALTNSLNHADADRVLHHIPKDAVLIDFVCTPTIDLSKGFRDPDQAIGPDRYYAMVATPDDSAEIMFLDLGEAEPIDDRVHRLRDALSHHTGSTRGIGVTREAVSNDCKAAACDVRRAVFDPVLQGIGDSKHLIICPDGELNLLPFGVLPREDGQFLVDRYVIQYVGSSRELVRFGEKDHTVVPGKPAVVADPDFDLSGPAPGSSVTHGGSLRVSRGITRGDMHFPLLPGTREECKCVAELLPGATLILGREATVPRFTELQAPILLHVATHGFFCPDQGDDPDDPGIAFARRLKHMAGGLQDIDLARESEYLRSGLVLSGVNVWARGDDTQPELRAGILTALDILGMDLLGTDLVVLSACDTGLGTVYQGQGVFGLRRAFALAGARSLVMTLWRVDDQITRDFMVEFYQLVVDGYPKAAALTEAQRRLKKMHPDPSAWGAFIFQGDPGPMQEIGPARSPRTTATTPQ